MNVDLEFFRIVEDLGPLGAFESHPSTSRPVGDPDACGCETDDGPASCSTKNPVESAWSKVTFALSGEGPEDRTITPFPKWDPATRTWWQWDESKGSWAKTF